MTTISVPISSNIEIALNNLIKNGYGSNRVDVVRKAIMKISEDEAVAMVLRAEQEPSLRGNLRNLAVKLG